MVWDPINEPQDYILLVQQKSPGIAEVVGASSVRKWDEPSGPGISGARSVFMGRPLAHFSVKLRLYTAEDWAAWHAWKPLVTAVPKRRGAKGKDTGALDISHPLLAEVGISSVAVEELKAPEQTDHGEWTIEIRFIEFRPPHFGALAKPEGAAATPVDPIEQNVIKPLLDQYNALAEDL